MHRKAAALIASIVLLPAVAFAQDRGTEADQEACTPDVFRLCQDFIPNEGPILACLQAKRDQLSTACEPVIFPRPVARAEVVRHHARRNSRKRRTAEP